MSGRAVFVLVGATGEYSDRSDWYVAAYLDKAQAERHQRQLEEYVSRAGVAMNEKSNLRLDYEERDAFLARPETKAIDPQMRIDYTGVAYFLVAVPLREVAP